MVRALSAVAAFLLLSASPVLAQAQPQPQAQASGETQAQPAPTSVGIGPTPPAGPPPGTGANPDPWEATNRQFYGIHQSIDRAVLRPAAMGYRAVTPGPIGSGIHNAIVNLSEPVVLMNDVAQFRFSHAMETLARFMTNTVFGIGGLVDVAAYGAGVAHHDNGFGTTLGVWGVRPGPYIFLPMVGPSTARDLFGKGVDMASDPLAWTRYRGDTAVSVTRAVAGGLDLRARSDDQLQQLEKLSTDSYATLRSFYLQSRQAQIRGGDVDLQALPEFEDEPAATPAAAGGADSAGAAPAAPAQPTGSEGPPVEPAGAPRP